MDVIYMITKSDQLLNTRYKIIKYCIYIFI